MDVVKKRISANKDMTKETSQTEIQREKIMNKEKEHLRTVGEEIFELIMAGKFPKLIIDTKPQIQEAWKTPSKINTLKSTPMYIIFKLQNRRKSILNK